MATGARATLSSAWRDAAGSLTDGTAAGPVLKRMGSGLEAAGFAVDYVALVDGPSLRAIDRTTPGARLIAAAKLRPVRLIDNITTG